MAEIVLGIGASHGPTIQSLPEDWLKLGQKDMEDPRYDFDAVLASASPEIERELEPEVLQRRYESIQRAIEEMSNVLQETAPDAIVCVSNPHGATPQDRMEPVFGIYMSHTESRVERSGHQTSGRRKAAEAQPAFVDRQVEPYATCPELADRLMHCLIADGIDVASCFQSDPTAGIEGPFTFAYDMFLPDRSTPVVPFLLSRYLPHQATSARCYTVGQSIRRAIESWGSDMRVAIMASGGLSHQIIDEELDRQVIEALQHKDVETLSYLPRERLNRAPGTPEILNWVVLAGAVDDLDMTLIDYVPCYRSLAGTGHGVTLAYWR